ncbi:hypothetical protein DP033_11730 [Escherichia coli]|nr:hypothetical protein [Escherichia coli]PSZ16309.1 hypothetical protein C7B04_14505 [Escherichia sp. 4726-5]PTN28606.1 hypothetical protein A7589_01380 [Escherichia sp. MOD1-EC6475]
MRHSYPSCRRHAVTFLCKRYQLIKNYIRCALVDNAWVAYSSFCLKMASDINAVSENLNSLAWL